MNNNCNVSTLRCEVQGDFFVRFLGFLRNFAILQANINPEKLIGSHSMPATLHFFGDFCIFIVIFSEAYSPTDRKVLREIMNYEFTPESELLPGLSFLYIRAAVMGANWAEIAAIGCTLTTSSTTASSSSFA